MLQWLKRRTSKARDHAESSSEPVTPQARVMSGEYLSLHKYLANRYANTVVLRFGEIEDLLGFKLPELARLRPDWWTNANPTTAQPSYSDSWMLAGRTATPNMGAQTVFFERATCLRVAISKY
jgi:hypothetical protein